MTDTDQADVRGEKDTEAAPLTDQPQTAAIVRLWAYRRVLLGAAAIGLAVTGLVYFLAPAEHLSTLRFRLLFEGADAGTYPSGVRFTTEDIKARSVLDQVYKADELDQWGSFEDFQMSFYIAAKPSAEMEALDSNYNSQLANRKLTAVERTRLEQEYIEKRSGLLRGIDYDLGMDLSLGFDTMPDELREKVLRDVLATWAHDAATRKGALKYQMTVLTKNILPSSFVEEDYFIAADMLRLKTTQVLKNIADLQTLPGAMSYRSTADKRMSLGEIEANLKDMLRFKLEPAMHLVRMFGLSLDPEMTAMYIQSSIYNITLSQKASADRTKALQESLTSYSLERRAGKAARTPGTGNGAAGGTPLSVPAMIPQFGDSFLDRIIEMASESEDIKFRQDYTERMTTEALARVEFDRELKLYEDMLKATLGGEDNGAGASLTQAQRARVEERVKMDIKKAYDELTDQTEQLGAIYEQLSAKNLNPPTELYSAPEPAVSDKVRGISLSKLAVYLVGIVGSMVLLASAGCLYHARIRSLAGKKAA